MIWLDLDATIITLKENGLNTSIKRQCQTLLLVIFYIYISLLTRGTHKKYLKMGLYETKKTFAQQRKPQIKQKDNLLSERTYSPIIHLIRS